MVFLLAFCKDSSVGNYLFDNAIPFRPNMIYGIFAGDHILYIFSFLLRGWKVSRLGVRFESSLAASYRICMYTSRAH